MMVLSKITATILFATMFSAIAVWAYWPANKATFERLAALPLQDD
ncbi:MAG: cbb3-type cytochrome c oxidase subunit 3 [Candidatus Sericytochromatia bacterium]|nr:cbb3-type cytochrome c oxidase subunit 3 [Candidatus Sericytochromatia bacterium]